MARITEVSVPPRIVVGEHVTSDFGAIGAHLAAGMVDARLDLLAGAAHVPNYECPGLSDPVLREVLTSVG